MKMLIQVVVVALIVGGVSAAGSFYWNQQQHKSAVSEKKEASATDAKNSDDESEIESTTDKNSPQSDSPATATPPAGRDEVATSVLKPRPEVSGFGPPVAARPPYEPNADEAGNLINQLRARAASASRQERRIAEREEVMKLVVEDLRVEQRKSASVRQRILVETGQSMKAIDEARRETEAEREGFLNEQNQTRKATEDQIEKLQRERDEAVQSAEKALTSAREEQEQAQKQLDDLRKPAEDRSGSPDETQNLKRLVGVVDSMPPEDTAKILQELVEKGKTEAVVAVLNSIKPRQSAKVLSAITEKQPILAADLIERLKRLKKEGGPPVESPK